MKLNPSKIFRIDISVKMLEIGKEKIKKKDYLKRSNLSKEIRRKIPFDAIYLM